MIDESKLVENIGEFDLPFELQLLENPHDKDLWNNYVNHKRLDAESSSIESKIKSEEALLALLYRRSQAYSDDYQVWAEFIDYYIDFVGYFSYNPKELNKIDTCFKHNIGKWGKHVHFWIKWFDFVLKYKEYIAAEEILKLANLSLNSLDYSNHLPIWNIILNNIVVLDGIDLSQHFSVYFSYMIFLKNSLEFDLNEMEIQENERLMSADDTVYKLLEFIYDKADIEKFDNIFNKLMIPKFLLKFNHSELDLYRKYFEKLVQLSGIKKDLLEVTVTLYNTILKKFPDQQSIFTIKYAKMFMKIGNFDKGVHLLEEHMTSSLTIKDFSMIFDSLTERLEKRIEELSESDDEKKLVFYINKLEYLLENRKLLLNDVKLRQNPNSPSAWLERLEIFKNEEGKVKEKLECYSKAVLSIVTKQIPSDEKHLFAEIWCDYAKVYFDNGDLANTWSLFETATKVPWTDIGQLETVWIEWIKCEINTGDLNQATHVASLSTAIPQKILNGKVNVDDESTSIHMKLFKSMRLWSLYLDLVENTKDFDAVCNEYDNAINLKVVNGVIVINYCTYLEENGYYEKSFSIFERGIKMFAGSSKDILFGIYVSRVLKYWKKLNWEKERVREIFEKGIDHFSRRKDTDKLRDTYILYANWEMEYGSEIRSLKVLREGIDKSVKQTDKLTQYKILIVNTIKVKNLYWAIDVFSSAIEELSVQIPGYIESIVDGFVKVEVALKEISKAREVLRYAAESIMEFNKNSSDRALIWELFKKFELENGDEDSYKNMLRRKQYLQNLYQDVEKMPEVESKVVTDLNDQVGFVKSSTGPISTTFTMSMVSVADDTSKFNTATDEINLEIDNLSDDENEKK